MSDNLETKKITDSESTTSFDHIFVNDGGKLRQITKEELVKLLAVAGKDGLDGKTPVKGTDYFTEADKQELVTDVLNALPIWNGGAY